MPNLLADLRLAWRSLSKSPGLVAVAVISLSLGIAVNVVIFAGVDILILRPLPYPDPDQLVQVWSANPARGWDESRVSAADFADWRREATGVDLALYGGGAVNLSDEVRPERVGGLEVSPSFLPILGAVPMLGRGFRPEEAEPGRGRVAMLSHPFWLRRFGADSTVVGRPIRLDGRPYTVVGILPASFRFGFGNDVYTPLVIDPAADRGDRFYEVIGRLGPGTTLGQAEAGLDRIAVSLAARYPVSNEGMETRVVSLKAEMVGDEAARGGLIAMVAVVFVLLIACANVANLLLVRGAVRSRELAVRAALGAGRRRLVRQLLVEGTLLGLVGGAMGIVLSFAGVQWFNTLLPPDMPRAAEVLVDGRALGFGLVITLLTGFGFSLVPALQATRGNLAGSLHDGGRGGSTGRSAGRLRSGLVVGELALALVLLVSAGLLIRAAAQAFSRPLGFEPAGALAFRMALPAEEYPDDAAIRSTVQQLIDRLSDHPAVASAGAVSALPLRGGAGAYYSIEGQEVVEGARRPVIQWRRATPGYAEAVGLHLVEGRWIGPADGENGRPVIVVTEALARRHWPNGGALGHRVVLDRGTFEIVGVVGDIPEFGRDDPAPPIAFVSADQEPVRQFGVVVRSTVLGGDGADLGPAARAALAEVAPSVPAYDLATLTEIVRQTEQDELIMPKLLGVFGFLALLLAIGGVYGVMAYVVAQRTLEMGIRRALGAQDRDILGLVLRYSGRLAAVGCAIGLGLALLSARGLSTFLLGLSPFDPLVFGGVTLALAGATLAAALIPARRATAVAPTEALRAE